MSRVRGQGRNIWKDTGHAKDTDKNTDQLDEASDTAAQLRLVTMITVRTARLS
jgi:hypothetical protein